MKGFFKAATVASAAAALSLALGGGVAEAQGVEGPPSAPEATPVVNVLSIDSHTTTHSLKTIDFLEKDKPAMPAVPTGDVLDFLAQSVNLAGRDVLKGGLKTPSLNTTKTVHPKVTTPRVTPPKVPTTLKVRRAITAKTPVTTKRHRRKFKNLLKRSHQAPKAVPLTGQASAPSRPSPAQ